MFFLQALARVFQLWNAHSLGLELSWTTQKSKATQGKIGDLGKQSCQACLVRTAGHPSTCCSVPDSWGQGSWAQLLLGWAHTKTTAAWASVNSCYIWCRAFGRELCGLPTKIQADQSQTRIVKSQGWKESPVKEVSNFGANQNNIGSFLTWYLGV